jgi:hypothetical protein
MKRLLLCFCALLPALHAAEPVPVDFTVKLETVMKHDDGKFLWFHPRASTTPGLGGASEGVVARLHEPARVEGVARGREVGGHRVKLVDTVVLPHRSH